VTVTTIAAAGIGMYISGVRSKANEQPKTMYGAYPCIAAGHVLPRGKLMGVRTLVGTGDLGKDKKQPSMDSGDVRESMHGKFK